MYPSESAFVLTTLWKYFRLPLKESRFSYLRKNQSTRRHIRISLDKVKTHKIKSIVFSLIITLLIISCSVSKTNDNLFVLNQSVEFDTQEVIWLI